MNKTLSDFLCDWLGRFTRIKLSHMIATLLVICNLNIQAEGIAPDGGAFLAEVSVSGQVLDENSNSMPGVNIVVKGTTIGTTTDVDGKFRVAVPDASAVLVFSFIGYEPQEIAVG